VREFIVHLLYLPFRSRRGSQENILENDSGKTSLNNRTRGGLISEIVMEGDRVEGEELSYWLRVSVSTSQLEKEVAAHPGVGEAVVRGVHVPGVGVLPRAYVTLKQGFSIPGEELANWFNSRLDWRHR
jgi:acyl-CoA synthetase (AMP-forming)/AMP-acid ligase II